MKKYIADHDEPSVVTNDYYNRLRYAKTIIIIAYDCIVIYYYRVITKNLHDIGTCYSSNVDEMLDVIFVQLVYLFINIKPQYGLMLYGT